MRSRITDEPTATGSEVALRVDAVGPGAFGVALDQLIELAELAGPGAFGVARRELGAGAKVVAG